MYKLFAIVALLSFNALAAQHILKIKVVHSETKEALPAATVSLTSAKKTMVTDSTGNGTFTGLAAGEYRLSISYVGFEEQTINISIPFTGVLEILLAPEEEEEEEVIVQSTRTSRTINNVPTRVETIAMEEIDEKSNMRPANVSMLLHESTGILVQQTSATSGNASIRLQGLDGRYTQLLKDGFPSFGNFASGLSVLEIPPLDLKQVEIIKGPVSPLYGGGAIAGVVNFISRTPKEKAENNFLINISNIGQVNVGYFSSKRNAKAGHTFLALVNKQKLFDVDHDDFTEVPRSFEITLHPKLFLYGKQSVLILGNSFTKGQREGGDVQVLHGRGDSFHTFFEENNTTRNITTAEWQRSITEKKQLTVKQSLSIFDRHIRVPGYHFDGISYNSFTDITFLANLTKHSLVAGANFVYDNFNEKEGSAANRDNKNTTAGVYLQDTWDASEKIKVESGMRFDYARYSNTLFNNNEFFVLPRISVLFKYNSKLSSRIGGGIGYKVPTLFTERSETIQYNGVQQINGVRAERSYGGTADINYRTTAGDHLDISFNQLFFYTWINKPLVLTTATNGTSRFENSTGGVESAGIETNLKLIYDHNFKLFLGYTYTHANARFQTTKQFIPLVPKHKFNSALIYEKHESIKLGLEGYYTSPQYLNNASQTPGYWELGFMAEKIWKKFSVYINFENFTDTRQGKFDPVPSGAHQSPVFDDIWTHTEGFVVNGGIKIRF